MMSSGVSAELQCTNEVWLTRDFPAEVEIREKSSSIRRVQLCKPLNLSYES